MVEKADDSLDPRIRRTRLFLQDALAKLLEKKEFDKISVQDITDAATVNRATFYDHYTDKFALLTCMVGTRFHDLLTERGVQFDGSCASALKAVALAVCDYLVQIRGADGRHPLEPHMESAIVAVVRRMLLEGLKHHRTQEGISPEVVAATASWAIYGAAREWAETANRAPAEEFAGQVIALVSPVLQRGSGLPQSNPV